jgi:hypothetical protein
MFFLTRFGEIRSADLGISRRLTAGSARSTVLILAGSIKGSILLLLAAGVLLNERAAYLNTWRPIFGMVQRKMPGSRSRTGHFHVDKP